MSVALATVAAGTASILSGCANPSDICGSFFVCTIDTRQGSESRLYMSPESPVEGEPVTLEVHRPPYPDPRTVSYLWSDYPGQDRPRSVAPEAAPPELLGGLRWKLGEESVRHSFSQAGVHWVHAYAVYATGHRQILTRTFIVRRAPSSTPPPPSPPPPPASQPTARLSASPNPAEVSETVSFDASASSASDGASITGYEWDLEGDGTYAAGGLGAYNFYFYDQPGTYNVGVRVTDSTGGSATQTVPLQVVSPSPSPAVVRQARRARGVPFSLRFSGRVTRVPEPTLSGRIVTTRGVGLSGRGRGGLARRAARLTAGHALLQQLMTGKWRMWLTSATDKRTGTGSITGAALVVASGGRGAARACVKIKAPVRRYRPQAASFTVVGGTGRAARLRASGRIAIPRIRGTEVPPLEGRVVVRSGARRSPPKGCGGAG